MADQQKKEEGNTSQGGDHPHSDFMTSEMVIGSLFSLGVDGTAFLLDSSGIGYVIATLMQGATVLAITWWTHSKGGKRAWALEKQLSRQAANFLPWIPTCTVILWVNAYKHNHPELAKLAKKIT